MDGAPTFNRVNKFGTGLFRMTVVRLHKGAERRLPPAPIIPTLLPQGENGFPSLSLREKDRG